ncbi:MAG: DUF4177 domain-containing protein [Pseudomonadota bacterium]
MQAFEYKIVPAPTRGKKGAGVKGPEARFAYGLEHAINTLAADGWEYLRADILPSEERQGLTSSQTIYRSVLVFRRSNAVDHTAAQDVVTPAIADRNGAETDIAQADHDESGADPITDMTQPDEDTSGAQTRDEAEVFVHSEREADTDPAPKVRDRAVSSLYPSADNSKQE